jgi:hypothetical protein
MNMSAVEKVFVKSSVAAAEGKPPALARSSADRLGAATLTISGLRRAGRVRSR